MTITDVKIHKINKDSNLKAFASITLDSAFVVGGLAVLDGKNGLFVQMPQKKGSDGKYYDQCFPLTKELRQQINEAVIKAYKGEDNENNDGIICDNCGKPFEQCECLPF